LAFLQQQEISPFVKSTNYFRCKSSDLLESGVLAFNKSQHNVVLGLLAGCCLSVNPTRKLVHGYGDKEIFWLAYEMINVSYSIDFSVGVIGVVKDSHLCGNILHVDPDKSPLWVQTSKEPQEMWKNYSHFALEPEDHSISWKSCLPLSEVRCAPLSDRFTETHRWVIDDAAFGSSLFCNLSNHCSIV